MTTEPLFGMALLTGLLGTGHCLGMCGGLISALSLSAEGRRAGALFPVLYHLGRLLTYAFLGWGVGWLGSALILPSAVRPYTLYLLLASDLFVILVGLASAGIWSRLGRLHFEIPGSARLLAAFAARLRRLPAPLSAFTLGLLLGFLPCCFLYAMALAAAQSGTAWTGAGVMLAFGVGTLPGLLLVGGVAQWLGIKGRVWMVRAAGLTVAAIGAWNLWRHLQMF